MQVERRKLLEEVMRRLIGGELEMVWALSAEFGEDLAKVVKRHLYSMGRGEVIAEPGRLEGLVIDVALWFMDHGKAYDPAGSLPWVWAAKPIRQLVSDEVGHRSVEFDAAGFETASDGVAPSLEPAVVELRTLAASQPTVALLIEAVEIVGSERDAKVHLEYRVQWALGDPSPSHTVAGMAGLEAANVRQIDTRMRKKVVRLASADERFGPLKELAWLK